MSSFDEAAKYLQIAKARKATLAEAQNNAIPFSKYYELRKTRGITRVNDVISIPAFNSSLGVEGALMGQINYTVEAPFKLIAVNMPFQQYMQHWICIRYRKDGVTYRYSLNVAFDKGYMPLVAGKRFHFVGEEYKGETIYPNFCIEFYRLSPILGTGQSPAFTLKTSLLSMPTSSNATVGTTYEGTLYTRAQLAIALPENIPSSYSDASKWLDN